MKRKWISLAAFSFLVLSSGFILATITKSLQFESSSPAAQIYFFRRQVRDETGKLIDLNKEPSPEPDSPASQGHGRGKNSNQGHSTALSLSSQGLDGGKQMPRYIMPRIYRKIDVPVSIEVSCSSNSFWLLTAYSSLSVARTGCGTSQRIPLQSKKSEKT